ncbi:MAG: glutamate racemase [Gammaproteobacteria bacterium]|nr:glutamate racemase [Gammaproteobacteria bacterium]
MALFGFIDSGIGGLTILEAVQSALPKSQFVYLADHQYAPYGNKTNAWLIQRLHLLCDYIISQHSPDAIVIACNTASTATLDYLRTTFDLPIIGVVPAIKQAAERSPNNKIGLLATPGTCQGHYSEKLITDFANEHLVIKVGTTTLVDMAEKKLQGEAVDMSILKDVIQPFIEHHCSHVVLGCTHFPHLRQELEQLAGEINWIDSASAIAKRCRFILDQHRFTSNHQSTESIYLSTAPLPDQIDAILQPYQFSRCHHVTRLDNYATTY